MSLIVFLFYICYQNASINVWLQASSKSNTFPLQSIEIY